MILSRLLVVVLLLLAHVQGSNSNTPIIHKCTSAAFVTFTSYSDSSRQKKNANHRQTILINHHHQQQQRLQKFEQNLNKNSGRTRRVQSHQEQKWKLNGIDINDTFLQRKTNVISMRYTIPDSTLWEHILPNTTNANTTAETKTKTKTKTIQSSFFSWMQAITSAPYPTTKDKNRGSIGIDTSVEFTSPIDGARRLIHSCYTSAMTTTTDCADCDCGLDTIQEESATYNKHHHEEEEDLESVIKNGFIQQKEYQDLLEFFTSIFSLYQTTTAVNNNNIYTDGNHPDSPQKKVQRYKARIVSSRGQIGQKCPRWHIDYVPLRLVMSIRGPGCMYIPYEHEYSDYFSNGSTSSSPWVCLVNRDALNELDVDDTKIANAIILPYGEDIQVDDRLVMNDTNKKKKEELSLNLAIRSKAGDAVILMGRPCEEEEGKIMTQYAGDATSSCNDGSASITNSIAPLIQAAPHRSPDLGEDEERILFTVDIVP